MDLVEQVCIGDTAGSPFGQRRASWLEDIWRTDKVETICVVQIERGQSCFWAENGLKTHQYS